MTCAQGLLRLLWGGARSWSAKGLLRSLYHYGIFMTFMGEKFVFIVARLLDYQLAAGNLLIELDAAFVMVE